MTQGETNGHVHTADELSFEEAAAYLGVSKQELPRILESYGIGRYYDPEEEGQFVYEKADLERAKASLDAETGSSADARRPQ
jgi:hypothetical protein